MQWETGTTPAQGALALPVLYSSPRSKAGLLKTRWPQKNRNASGILKNLRLVGVGQSTKMPVFRGGRSHPRGHLFQSKGGAINQLDMKGRCAIVTGGASGIGLAIAKRLARSGANVAIWDMNEKTMADTAKSLGAPKTHTARVDVTKLDQVESAFKSTLAAFGKVDALVCSAGIAGLNKVSWELPADDWLRVHDINLNGVFYCCRTVVPHMIKNNYGRIVNIASIAGKEGNPNAAAYSSSKAAVIGLTKSLGKETAKNGI